MTRAKWHGTVDGYTNHLCRCDRCRNANRLAMQAYRAKLRTRPIPDYVHGSVNGYTNYQCRCELCLAAHREAKANPMWARL